MEAERKRNMYLSSKRANISFASEKKKKNILSRQKIIVTLFLILFIGIGVLLTPVFNVQKITVSGNNYISTDKILEISTAKTNKNIFLFRKAEAEKKIGELSFADEVTVTRIFPSEVSITIKECVPLAQIKCGQSLYLIIDKNGKILDTAGVTDKYSVPVISDAEVSEFAVGEKVNTENDDGLKRILELLSELEHNGLTDKVTGVYADNIRVHAVLNGNIDCDFGYEDNLSYRVKFVKECLEKIPEGQGGKISFMDDFKAVFTKEEESAEE